MDVWGVSIFGIINNVSGESRYFYNMVIPFLLDIFSERNRIPLS
jgi:hypothetical protein